MFFSLFDSMMPGGYGWDCSKTAYLSLIFKLIFEGSYSPQLSLVFLRLNSARFLNYLILYADMRQV